MENPVFPFPFTPTILWFLNNIYEEFPRAPRENQEKEGRSSSLFLTAGELRPGIFRIVVGNAVIPVLFPSVLGLLFNIYKTGVSAWSGWAEGGGGE